MIKGLVRANFVYAIGSISHSAALFFLVPYLVNALTTAEFGIWSLLEVSILILSLFVSAGLDIGLMREYWDMGDHLRQSRLVGTVFLGMVAWGAFFLGVLVLLVSVGNLGHFAQTTTDVLLLALLIVFTETLLTFTLNLFRIREEPVQYVLLSLGRMILFMSVSILLVVVGFGLKGALLGRAIASMVVLIIGLTLARKYFSLKFDWLMFKRVISYGLPLLPANLMAFVLLGSDRYFLQYFSSANVVGVYSFAYKIVSVFDMLLNRPFALDWAPRRFKLAKLNNAQQKYADVLLIYFFLATFLVLLIITIAPNIYYLIAPIEYWAGLEVLPILLLAALFYGLSYPLTVGIVIKDKTIYAAGIGTLAAVLCLGLNFILIPRFGMAGAAWGTVISYAVWTGGMTVVSLYFYPIPYPPVNVLAILFAGMVGYFGSVLISGFGEHSLTLAWITGARLVWVFLVFGALGLFLSKRIFRQETMLSQDTRVGL